jgi:homoserine O-succinyltransferase
LTLDQEYHRDIEAGLMPSLPENYYRNDDSSQEIMMRWKSHGNLFFTNWLNYYVYQTTPYDLNDLT